MDYTLSNGYATDAGTGQRMHLQAQAIPTAVSDLDMNDILWNLMEIVKAAGLAAAQFDKTVPATYQKLLTALRSAGVFQTQATNDSSTKVATTAFANPGSSLAINGYQKLPSGLIIEWGVFTPAAGGSTMTFPVTFPNFCRSFVGTVSSSSGTSDTVVSYSLYGTISIGVQALTSSTGAGVSAPVSWIAIGY